MKIKQLLAGIPHKENRNVVLFYIFTTIHAAFFADGNWIFLYLIYMTYGQLGIMDSVAFGIGLLLEIPTGAIADLFGRKVTIQISSFFITVGIMMQALGLNAWALFFGNIIFFIGMSFYSGAADALIYDTLQEKNLSGDYEKLYATSKSFHSLSYIIAVLIGGLVATINVRLPWLLWGILHGIGFILTFFLYEPKVDSIKFSLKSYLTQNLEGFKQLFLPKLKPFVVFIFLILGINYIYDWGYLKPAIALSFDFSSIGMGVVFAAGSLLSAVLINFLPALRKKLGDYRGMLLLNTVSILAVFLFAFKLGYWGTIPIILMFLIGNFAGTWITIIINAHVPSKYRATTLSTVAMFLKIPYVLTAFFIGNLIDQGHMKEIMLWAVILLSVISMIEMLLTRRNKTVMQQDF